MGRGELIVAGQRRRYDPAMLALLLPLAFAAAPTDLNGRWTLDLAASDSVDPLLEAVGASWTTRQLAAHISVTQELTVGSGTLTIAAVSNVGSKTDTVPTDGTATYGKSEFGSGTRRCSWVGAELHCASHVQVTGGAWGDLTLVRKVDGAGLMHQVYDLKLQDGRAFHADRVFRKG